LLKDLEEVKMIDIPLCSKALLATGALAKHSRVKAAIGLLESWLEAQIAYEGIPGMSMAVVYDQELVWARGLAWADRDKKTPATPETLYGIGSISKLFTSIAVMRLRDEGKLRLEDPIVMHLPWFNIQQSFSDSPPITIATVLSHMSGLPRDSVHSYWSAPYHLFPTVEELRKTIASQSTVFPADSHFNYSNLGYALLGEVVAVVSGQCYDTYINNTILAPLGLEATATELPLKHVDGLLASGYSSTTRERTQNRLPFFQARAMAPAAGYSSSVLDLARFSMWLFRVPQGDGREILKAETLAEMQRPPMRHPEVPWGLGFTVWNVGETSYAGHGGICAGYRSQLILRPKEKIAVAFLTNSSGVNSALYAQRACEIMAPAIAEALASPESEDQQNLDFGKICGTYSSYPWGGEIAVLPWKDGLATVDFPSNNPLAGLERLKHIDGMRFRSINEKNELAPEETFFELGSEGKVTKMWNEGNFKPKI